MMITHARDHSILQYGMVLDRPERWLAQVWLANPKEQKNKSEREWEKIGLI